MPTAALTQPGVVPVGGSAVPGSGPGAGLDAAAAAELISLAIRGIPDFPKPGILFWDVTTLLLDPRAFQLTIDLMASRYRDQQIDVVAGFEARGFIFGAPLALALGVPFVPLRKPGKLPGETVCESYITEYSTDSIEMHTGAVAPGQRVLLVDDLIATGGTLRAGINLVRKVGGVVVEAACVIELPALKGREKLEGTPLFVLIEKEGDSTAAVASTTPRDTTATTTPRPDGDAAPGQLAEPQGAPAPSAGTAAVSTEPPASEATPPARDGAAEAALAEPAASDGAHGVLPPAEPAVAAEQSPLTAVADEPEVSQAAVADEAGGDEASGKAAQAPAVAAEEAGDEAKPPAAAEEAGEGAAEAAGEVAEAAGGEGSGDGSSAEAAAAAEPEAEPELPGGSALVAGDEAASAAAE
ncbi:APT4 [Scenedesmus sp. PABB004]|nr:APT4 [Scenedesmus sp. PABB004]